MNTITDDFSYTVENNVAFDPKIPITLLKLQAVDSASVERQNTVMDFDAKTLPLLLEEKAKPYGVQPNGLWPNNQ